MMLSQFLLIDCPCDHFRDVPWEDIFKLHASAAAHEFCEWVQVRIDVTGFGMLVFFKLKSCGISGQIFSLISSLLSNRRL